ncbi:MAG: hypothetical protein WCK28_14245, partial [Burkholderiales bacterium]
MKGFLSLLVVANLLLFAWFRGWMAPFGGDGRDPQRIERQVAPERLRVVSGPKPASGGAATPAAGGGATTPAAPGAAASATAAPAGPA